MLFSTFLLAMSLANSRGISSIGHNSGNIKSAAKLNSFNNGRFHLKTLANKASINSVIRGSHSEALSSLEEILPIVVDKEKLKEHYSTLLKSILDNTSTEDLTKYAKDMERDFDFATTAEKSNFKLATSLVNAIDAERDSIKALLDEAKLNNSNDYNLINNRIKDLRHYRNWAFLKILAMKKQ